jgi:hypothetical protein
MLHFLADNIFILLDGRLFQRTIGIPKGRNRPPILADLFKQASIKKDKYVVG